jgi:hypothetical protein
VDGGLRERLGALVGRVLRAGRRQSFRVAALDGRHLHLVGPTGRRDRVALGALDRAAAAASSGRPVAGHFHGQRARVLAVLEAAGAVPPAAR